MIRQHKRMIHRIPLTTLFGAAAMGKEKNTQKDVKKKAALTPKEKKAAKKVKQDSKKSSGG